MRQNTYEYDAFISHAVEDKIPIANELCAKLEMAGLKIWYSGKELGVGDSIEKTIEKGLNRSRYGIVIFSPTYLSKNWTIREFYTLLAKEIEEHKVILPVLYNVTLDELKNKDLVMADRFAVNADMGIDFVAERLVREIKRSMVVKQKQAWLSKIWFVLILSLLVNVALLLKGITLPGSSRPGETAQPFEAMSFLGENRNHEAFFTEIQSLFGQLNTCSCDHAANPPQSHTLETHLTQNNVSEMDDGHYQQTGMEKLPAEGKKTTMAVVFQIETFRNSRPAPEQDIDELANVISLAEEKDRFVKVNSRKNIFQPKMECRHSANADD